MFSNPKVFEGVKQKTALTGIVETMVARLPPGIGLDEASVVKALLADGWTPGFIAEQLDDVMEKIARKTQHTRP